MSLSQDTVFAALKSSLGPWTSNEEIRLRFMRFPYGFSEIGDVVECSLAEEIDYRQQFVDKPLPRHFSDDLNKRKLLQPLELGVVVDTFELGGKLKGNRKVTDVVAVTWIAIDCDSGVGGKPIVEKLQELQAAYIYAESSTSRLGGSGPAKWHLFVPLREPKWLPDRKASGVAAVESAEKAAKWWATVHNHVATHLFALGGLEHRSDDASLDRLVQGTFVHHRPDGSPKRMLYFSQQGGCCLDLDRFLDETSFEDPTPGVVLVEDIERPDSVPERVTSEASPDDGPTPGENPGTLSAKALRALGLLGDWDHKKGGFMALCPWRDSHRSAVERGKQDEFSDSTMVLFEGGSNKLSGFHCFHNGCAATAGGGHAVSTSAILKLARERGVSSDELPDTSAWSGALALQGTPEPAPTPLPAPSLPTPFISAPPVDGSSSAPGASEEMTLPDRVKRPIVAIDSDDLDGMMKQGIAALSKHPKIFKVRTGDGWFKLVDLLETTDREVPTMYVRACSSITLPGEIQKVSKWVHPNPKISDEKLSGVEPYSKTISAILHAGDYPGVREIRGVVTTPTFNADGVLVQTPGYNASMCVYYQPTVRVPRISCDPSRSSLEGAKELLLDVIRYYPFKKGSEMLCNSVWLAGIFTRLMRHCFKGNIPFFLVSANERNNGKGKLIDAAAVITDNVQSESVSFSASDDENERVIGMFMQGGAPVVHVDNVRGVLSSTKYEAYSTTPTYSTRNIGSSGKISKAKQEGIVDTTIWFSGNNLTTGGDMARRSLRIDIDDLTGDPSRRKIPSDRQGLLPYVRRERPRLLAAALTLISGYFAARQRGFRAKLDAYASFEEWSIVREVVVWMGLPDPILAVGSAADDDADGALGHLVKHLRDIGCEDADVLQSDLVKKLIADNTTKPQKHAAFYSFLVDHKVELSRPTTASQSLGAWLKSQGYVGRTYKDTEGRRWRLEKRRVSAGFALSVREQKD